LWGVRMVIFGSNGMGMKQATYWQSILIYLIFSGCATSTKSDFESLNKAGVYYQSYEQMPYKKMLLNETYKDEISASSNVFDFEDGKSFFLAYQLPSSKQDFELTISSYMIGEHINKAYIFYPTVLFLNEDYAIVGMLSDDDFSLRNISKDSWGLPYKYEAVVKVPAWDNVNKRYMVVYTSDDQKSQLTSVNRMKATPLAEEVGVIPGEKQEKLVKHSPVGRIQVEIEISSVIAK